MGRHVAAASRSKAGGLERAALMGFQPGIRLPSAWNRGSFSASSRGSRVVVV